MSKLPQYILEKTRAEFEAEYAKENEIQKWQSSPVDFSCDALGCYFDERIEQPWAWWLHRHETICVELPIPDTRAEDIYRVKVGDALEGAGILWNWSNIDE